MIAKSVLDEWRELRRRNPKAGGEGVTQMLREAGDVIESIHLAADVKPPQSSDNADKRDEPKSEAPAVRGGPWGFMY